MSMTAAPKRRKAKVPKGQSISARRNADRRRRAGARPRAERRERDQRHFKYKVKVVRTYRGYRAEMSEQQAVARTLARYQPREAGHFRLCASSIRQWHRLAEQAGFGALRPQSSRPQTIHYQVPEVVVGIIFTLRRLLGWGGHRIAAEMQARGIGQVSAKTFYAIFERLGLPVKLYALKGRSAGIAYRRYEKVRPNMQWHIDLKQLTLLDGETVWVCVIVDDHSRYALAAVAGRSATTEWVAQVTAEAIRRAGQPQQIVSDNGRPFVAVWEETLTKFGQLLAEQRIEHLTCAPYYPQGNGKVEAFIATLSRELLEDRPFASLADLQAALDRYLSFYNNYRLHSALNWQPPVARYAGRAITVRGLAGLPHLERMAADPTWGHSVCDPPIEITPFTARNSSALVPVDRFPPLALTA
jgi:transposase InsO family protein